MQILFEYSYAKLPDCLVFFGPTKDNGSGKLQFDNDIFLFLSKMMSQRMKKMKPMRKIDLLVKYWSFKTLWMVISTTFYSLLQIDNMFCGLSLCLVLAFL